MTVLAALVTVGGCGPRDPHALAAAADARAKVGIYAWLADHDPSGLVIVGLDEAVVREVAPDARVRRGPGPASDCAYALRQHALLAEIVPARTARRDRVVDCGYALYHDDGSIVVAPR